MTLNEMRKRTGWRVVAGGAAVGVVGLSGLALAGGNGNADELPGAIRLKDASQIGSGTGQTQAPFEVPMPFQVAGDSTFDSPLDDAAGGGSGAGQDSVASFDSPAAGGGSPVTPGVSAVSASADSPDSPVAPASAPSVADSVSASVDSPESPVAPTVADSVDSASVDSPDFVPTTTASNVDDLSASVDSPDAPAPAPRVQDSPDSVSVDAVSVDSADSSA